MQINAKLLQGATEASQQAKPNDAALSNQSVAQQNSVWNLYAQQDTDQNKTITTNESTKFSEWKPQKDSGALISETISKIAQKTDSKDLLSSITSFIQNAFSKVTTTLDSMKQTDAASEQFTGAGEIETNEEAQQITQQLTAKTDRNINAQLGSLNKTFSMESSSILKQAMQLAMTEIEASTQKEEPANKSETNPPSLKGSKEGSDTKSTSNYSPLGNIAKTTTPMTNTFINNVSSNQTQREQTVETATNKPKPNIRKGFGQMSNIT